jgi:hypothetical protein
MSENIKLILLILLTFAAFLISRRFAGWRISKAAIFIIQDLKAKQAFDPGSAVELPYCVKRMFRFGLKDYRPLAMEQLVKLDVVRVLEGGKYYLREGYERGEAQDSTKA